MKFRLWIEETQKARPLVFSDLDETLVHPMEVGWLKESPKNRDFAKMVVPEKHPYPDVKQIHAKGKDMFIFPRPGSIQFLETISKFADIHILSHNEIGYLRKVIKALNWNKYITDCFSTRDTEPGELAKKFDLSNKKWVLVDNLDIHSIEVINKMRILGLGVDETEPKQIAKQVVAHAEEHCIDVSDWIPTVNEYDDFELWRAIPKIKEKLGINWTDD